MSTTAQFTDTSDGGGSAIVMWMWDFGDGCSGIEQHPTHTFNNAGNYLVSLIVVNECGNRATITKPVEVTEIMTTYTAQLRIENPNQMIVRVPIAEATIPIRFIDDGLDSPLVAKEVGLFTMEGGDAIQVKVTDSEGIVLFENVAHGLYNVTITY